MRLTEAYFRALGALYKTTGRPIILGPWRSEVGFEVLYWLPFLRWFKTLTGLKAEQFVVLTRGGAGALYPHMQGIDLFTLRTVDDLRLENAYDRQRTGMQKQLGATDWDADVVKEAARRVLGRGARYHVFHPSLMYRALAPWWNQERGLNYLMARTEFQPLLKPAFKDLQLPGQFIAVKWYDRATFPIHQEPVKQFAAKLTGTVASHIPVVVLASHHGGDEHADLVVEGPNIFHLPKVEPHETVHLQAAVLGRASAYVGTYGGVAQMALRMGVPSLSVFHQWGGTALAHLTLSHWLSLSTGTNFQVGNLSDATLWQKALTVAKKAEAAA